MRKDNFPKFVAFLCLKETFHLNFDLLIQAMLIVQAIRFWKVIN